MTCILQVSQSDIEGGAAKIAFELHHAYRQRGHEAWLAVSRHKSQASAIKIINHNAYHHHPWARICLQVSHLLTPLTQRSRQVRRVQRLIEYIGQPSRLQAMLAGHEEFDFPATWHLLDLPPQHPELVHLHNLHSNYFDLRALPWLSKQLPVVLTLHDAWLLAGHCAHSFDCQRWQSGCGNCPDLSIPPRLLRDGTAYNWQRKRDIYAQCRFYVATPSRWLMEKVEKSMLAEGIAEARLIPHGVDQTIFHPASKQAVRASLGLSPDAIILLFAATSIRKNRWKDYQTLHSAVALTAQQLPNKEKELIFIALGEEAEPERIGDAQIRFVPLQNNPQAVAQYYQAADIYLHAAKADTFPNVILEALSCGTPVVATAVGGIPEQVEEGVTGFLVPAGDSESMAERILKLIASEPLRHSMGQNGSRQAKRAFDAKRMIDDYLTWYDEILINSGHPLPARC